MEPVVIAGGTTERHDSIISGTAVEGMLREAGHSPRLLILDDFSPSTLRKIPHEPTIIMLHGGHGEGGPLQGYLEMIDVPFSGSRTLASALALNKWFAKRLFREAGIAVPAARLAGDQREAEAAVAEIGYPLIAKPVDGGSSQGVRLVSGAAELSDFAMGLSCDKWLLETFVAGRNLTVAILENKEKLHCFRPLEICLDSDAILYDEEAKTKRKRRYSLLGPSESRLEQRIVELGVLCHRTLGCFGATRVDLIVDQRGEPQVLEINTVPGMSESGNYRTAYRMSGVSDAEFCELLISTIA